jgi:hypothetical protein
MLIIVDGCGLTTIIRMRCVVIMTTKMTHFFYFHSSQERSKARCINNVNVAHFMFTDQSCLHDCT